MIASLMAFRDLFGVASGLYDGNLRLSMPEAVRLRRAMLFPMILIFFSAFFVQYSHRPSF